MGWVGSALLVLGMIAVGHKRRWGFAVGGAGECLWVAQAARTGQTDLLVICLTFVGLYIYNWYVWGKPVNLNLFKNE